MTGLYGISWCPPWMRRKTSLFTQGGEEDIAYANGKEMLKVFDKCGIKYEYSEMPGGHSWHVWRHDLHNLAPRLFK